MKLAQTVISFQIAFMFPECETIDVGGGVEEVNLRLTEEYANVDKIIITTWIWEM